VHLNFAKDGVVCTIAIPETHLFMTPQMPLVARGT
jgi:hypothetical protein